MVEQRQFADEMVRQFYEGCELLKVMTPQEWDEGQSDRYRRFCDLDRQLTWGLIGPWSASVFDARLDGPCDMRPEYAQAVDWPISQAWRRALVEASGITPRKFEPF
jgi:hypothetical protein